MFAVIFREKETKNLIDCMVFKSKDSCDNWLITRGYKYSFKEKSWQKINHISNETIECEVLKVSDGDGSISIKAE